MARRSDQLRQMLAQEAARLMVKESVSDYQWAKEKAAQRLGVKDRHSLPLNEEIDYAAAEYARIFSADAQQNRLSRLRGVALEAMEFFQAFDPYLTGGVASGTVGEHTAVVLELYTDTPEGILHLLQDTAIPFTEHDFTVTSKPHGRHAFPKVGFLAGGTPVELLILPTALRQQKIAGKETARLSLKQLRVFQSGKTTAP